MEVSIFLPWIVILSHFGCISCEEYQRVDRYLKNHERCKRNHESGNLKLVNAAETEPDKTTIPTGKSTPQKLKTVPKSRNKEPITEKNEKKDTRTVNKLLEEIAALAQNKKETKNITKIKHLVDEIDNLYKVKTCVKSKDVTPEKEHTANKISQTNKVSQNCNLNPKTDLIKDIDNKNKGLVEVNANKLLLTNGKTSNNEICTLADETTTKEDIIELEEHKYEEELLRSPCKYTQNNKQNLYTGQVYNAGYIGQYANNQNSNTIRNYDATSNSYPFANYGKLENGNNGYYNYNSPSATNEPYCYENDYSWMDKKPLTNPDEDMKETTDIQSFHINVNDNINSNHYVFSNNNPSSTYRRYEVGYNAFPPSPTDLPYYQMVDGYTKLRKSWLDRDSIISEKNHDERLVDENRQEITSVQSPDYFKKYYTVTQKHVISDSNDALLNDYSYRYP